MFRNGNWDGQEFREYDENGNLKYEVGYDGYSAKYYKVVNGEKVAADDSEKQQIRREIEGNNNMFNAYK